MISEFLLNIVFGISHGALSLLPDISLDVDSSSFEYFLAIVRSACYLLPMGTVRMILSIVVAISIWRIGVAIVKAVWDLLPFA